MSTQIVQFDDLDPGKYVEIILDDSDCILFGHFIEYAKKNGIHLLSFNVLCEGKLTKMDFETVDILSLFSATETPPVAEAASDFDPADLGEDYPC